MSISRDDNLIEGSHSLNLSVQPVKGNIKKIKDNSDQCNNHLQNQKRYKPYESVTKKNTNVYEN